MSQLITLQNDQITVTVSTLGAEMQSVATSDGKDWLWNGDAAYWTGRAPVLFPYAGGMRDNEYVWQGKTYPMQKHGFARRSEFSVESQTETEVCMKLDKPFENYPFKYAFFVHFSLEGSGVHIDYTTQNNGDAPLYYSTGAHEAFMTPGGITHYSIVFDTDEAIDYHTFDGVNISKDTTHLKLDDKTLPLNEDFFTYDAIMIFKLDSRSVTIKNDMNRDTVKVDFPDFDHLLIWKKPFAPYLCIEPWANTPDLADTPHEIEKKNGIIRLDAGESKTLSHTIYFDN